MNVGTKQHLFELIYFSSLVCCVYYSLQVLSSSILKIEVVLVMNFNLRNTESLKRSHKRKAVVKSFFIKMYGISKFEYGVEIREI
jgi:hypothetical protein